MVNFGLFWPKPKERGLDVIGLGFRNLGLPLKLVFKKPFPDYFPRAYFRLLRKKGGRGYFPRTDGGLI